MDIKSRNYYFEDFNQAIDEQKYPAGSPVL
jgi:hypothetical protein